jgi:hypothetical protein
MGRKSVFALCEEYDINAVQCAVALKYGLSLGSLEDALPAGIKLLTL